jgi:hypothetical protein
MRPRHRRELGRWTQTVFALSTRRVSGLMMINFVAVRLLDGRWFRVLTVVDQFTRECLLLLVDSSLTGQKGGLGTVAGDRRARNAGVDHGRYWH